MSNRKVYGVTRCIECRKPFEEGQEVAEVEAQEQSWHHTSVPGYMVRGGYHKVTVKWHRSCLDRFEAAQEAYREQVAADNAAMVAAMRAEIEAAAGS